MSQYGIYFDDGVILLSAGATEKLWLVSKWTGVHFDDDVILWSTGAAERLWLVGKWTGVPFDDGVILWSTGAAEKLWLLDKLTSNGEGETLNFGDLFSPNILFSLYVHNSPGPREVRKSWRLR